MNQSRRSRALALFFAVFSPLAALNSSRAGHDDGAGPEKLVALADAVGPSLVRVEYTLRYDKGEAPGSAAAAWERMMLAAVRDEASSEMDFESLIRDERPLVRAGYLLGDGRIVTRDPRIHPRFIASIAVRSGESAVTALPDGYAHGQDALLLKPAAALSNARPLVFDAKAPTPHHAVSYTLRSGAWTMGLGSAPAGLRSPPDGAQRSVPAPAEVLVVDSTGKAVGLSFRGELALDGSWKGSPAEWPVVREAEMAKLVADLEKAAGASLPRVEVRFRSPRSGGGEGNRRYRAFRPDDGDSQSTEWNGSGVLVSPTTVLVLADFKPKLTARIESIVVHADGGAPVTAAFAGTLKDYTGFLATLTPPLSSPARLATGPLSGVRHALLLKAEVAVLGEVRTAYFWRDRIDSFTLGRRGRLFPVASAGRGGSRPWENETNSAQNFLFDLSGALVALPLGHRERVASQERFAMGEISATLLPAAHLAEVLADTRAAIDPENQPLSEEEENRLAWLGVELQPMDPDLARMNKVVDQTGGGRTGATVTYLYPDSPAAGAGIEVGDIILRLHVQGQPKPLEVQLEPGMEGMDQFWQMYDRLPDEYFDQIPQPWGSAETSLTRALTDIGFATPFSVDLFRDGKVITRNMKVTQGPAHYNAARRFKSEPAGLTVRELTYEVRRYFQLNPADPGVILSKIEKGGRASVAGLKPYEIITSVNDTPVALVADFEKAIAGGGEFRLSVKRMTEGRIVKLKISAATEKAQAAEGEGDGAE